MMKDGLPDLTLGMASAWTSGSFAAHSAQGASVRPPRDLGPEMVPIAVKFGMVIVSALLLCVAANALGRRFR